MACQGACPDLAACPLCDATCQPVCGLTGSLQLSFTNLCLLECLGAEMFYSGGPCPQ
jgi:hypothetical protein